MKCIFMMLVMIYNTHPNPQYHTQKILEIARYNCYYSKKYDLSPILVLSLQKYESNYKPRTKSKTNDCGLMQINDPDGDCKKKCDLKQIHCNIKVGTKYLSDIKQNCINNHDHNHRYWIRHYNWGNEKHYKKILWIKETFEKAFLQNSLKTYKMIKNQSYPSKFSKYIIKDDSCIS